MVCVLSVLTFCLYNYLYSTRTQNRVFAKAEFTNPIPQKIRRTKKYCGIPQNKGHEFHNIFKFCGTTPQIIPHPRFFSTGQVFFVENRFRFRKSISTSDSTNKIRTFFVEFRFVNSAFANTLIWSCIGRKHRIVDSGLWNMCSIDYFESRSYFWVCKFLLYL